jgi:hypothetical protein
MIAPWSCCGKITGNLRLKPHTAIAAKGYKANNTDAIDFAITGVLGQTAPFFTGMKDFYGEGRSH